MSRTDLQTARAQLTARLMDESSHPILRHEGCTGRVTLDVYRDRKAAQTVSAWRCSCGARAEVRR